MLSTTLLSLLSLLSLPLLALSASAHDSSSRRSGRPHTANLPQKRIYGLSVHMDTVVPPSSNSAQALEARIVVPDHVTEEDLYRREVFLARQGGVESEGRMLKKRAGIPSSCKAGKGSSSSSSKAAAAASVKTATKKVVAAVSTHAVPPASTASTKKAVGSFSSSSAAAGPQASSNPSTSPSSSSSSSSVTYESGWTSVSSPSTSANSRSAAVSSSSLQRVTLDEAVKATKGSTPAFSNAPDGSHALTANYKANDVGADSGWSYYANGPVDISGAQEVELTYSVYFAQGFQWTKGGKLPGMYGGVGSQTGCSGGDQTTRDICFSTRLMWREQGAGEIYTYLPISPVNTAACKASGSTSVCDNQTYGLSFGRNNFSFKAGTWVTVKERTRLNDVGQNNGYVYLTVDGTTAIKAENLSIRTRADSKFEGMMMSSFFGGSSADYAPSSAQQAWFKDFTLGVIA